VSRRNRERPVAEQTRSTQGQHSASHTLLLIADEYVKRGHARARLLRPQRPALAPALDHRNTIRKRAKRNDTTPPKSSRRAFGARDSG